MNDRLQLYLDGELPLEALSPQERAEAERWHALLGASRRIRSESAPPWLETRVMASLPVQPAQVGVRGVISWLTRPQQLRVRPISLATAGAAAVLLLFLFRSQPASVPQIAADTAGNVHPAAAEATSVVYVQFVLATPNASTVSVAGDFNAWDVRGTPLMDTDGDGVWTALVALRPGLHKYMFVVDGEKWITDPQAESYVDDGFGMRNAVLSVAQPGSARAI